MTGRTHIPSSAACGQWETFLADALDGLLRPEDEATFSAHMAGCEACTALFEEARRGREWLEFLAPEPEVPVGLVDRILQHTGPGHAADFEMAAAGHVLTLPGVAAARWQKPGFMGFIRRFAEPRLMMTAAMAFFSVALTLNLMGIRVTRLRLSDLRPAAVRSVIERQLTMASVPIIRYYDHLRFVYEVQATMRELRGTPAQGEGQDEETQPQNSQPVTPGESKHDPGQTPQKNGGLRPDPPQESGNPVSEPVFDNEYLETSIFENQPTHVSGSALAGRERGTVWIA